LLLHAQHLLGTVASGRFGAYMLVILFNDGPVTFLLHTLFY
jgi:D-Tyr-tRNAtyr deacylase